MILPEDLTPFPSPLRGDEAAARFEVMEDDFVRAGDVRRVLLGPTAELPVEGLSADDFDSFAGRSDVPMPPRTGLAAKVGGSNFEGSGMLATERLASLHPAFESMPARRRAAPPQAGMPADREASFGRSRLSDFAWVMGMGMAAAAILFSGTLVDFISREAVRRSQAALPPAPQVIRISSGITEQGKDEPRPQSLASTVRPVEER